MFGALSQVPNVPSVLSISLSVSVMVTVSLSASAGTGAVSTVKARTNVASSIKFLVLIIEQGLNASLTAETLEYTSSASILDEWRNVKCEWLVFEWQWRLG